MIKEEKEPPYSELKGDCGCSCLSVKSIAFKTTYLIFSDYDFFKECVMQIFKPFELIKSIYRLGLSVGLLSLTTLNMAFGVPIHAHSHDH